MAKRKKRKPSFDDKLARIEAQRERGGALDELAVLLGDDEPYVAGAAAAAAAELGSRAAPALAEALIRLVRGDQPDDGCMASDRVIDALLQLDADEPDAYRAGLGYVKRERAGLDIVDRAIGVRIGSATGLIRGRTPGALLDVTPLLCDAEPAVRAGTAQAIAQLRSEAAAALLHLKLLEGDATPEVLGACLEGMLAVDPARYLPSAAAALDDDDLDEIAALVLGESRLPAALAVLRRAIDGCPSPRRRRMLLLAVALLRSDEALELLFGYVARASEATAVHAVEALAVHRHSPAVAERLRALATRSRKVKATIARIFDRDDG